MNPVAPFVHQFCSSSKKVPENILITLSKNKSNMKKAESHPIQASNVFVNKLRKELFIDTE